ncbi:MAG: TCR/Tet family MFS transporter [Rhodospirillaceae bacterium]
MSAGETATAPVQAAPKRALAFIYAFVVLDVLSFGMIIPVFPKLVEQFTGSTSAAASLIGLFAASWALMQFFFSPMAGMLSDRFGRRPVLLISCTGLGLDFLLMALAPNFWWLWVGRMISGLTMASFSTSSAYIADVTAPEKRAAAYGMLGAAFGLGFILGPAFGGLLGSIDLRLPFFIAAGATLANALYGIFVLPESLAPENRTKTFDWRRANPVGALILLRSHVQLTGLAAVHFCMTLMHNVFPSIFVLYAGYRYGWGEIEVGLVLAGVGAANIIVMGGMVKPVVKRFGERTALLGGLLCGAVGVTFYAFADTGRMFWFAVPFAALMSLHAPALQGLMTRLVSHAQQGLLQGAMSSITGITGMIGPIVFSQVFAYFIAPERAAPLPGAPFLLAGAMLWCALGLAAWVTRSSEDDAAVDAAAAEAAAESR